MSYITRTGNLAETPELRHNDAGKPYTYARVLVSDGVQQPDGSWGRGPTTAYSVGVSGSQAENLVEAAERSGNIRVTFSGRYSVSEYQGVSGTSIDHNVRADEIAVSLRGQSVTVERTSPASRNREQGAERAQTAEGQQATQRQEAGRDEPSQPPGWAAAATPPAPMQRPEQQHGVGGAAR